MSGSIIHESSPLTGAMRQTSVNGDNSPLKIFTQAKTRITDIFRNIASYVSESNKFLDDVSRPDRKLVTPEKHKEIQQLKDKVNLILSVISRNHMKVVFFGRTSNGKSTTMNAMLRERILPAGMGHTTNCFLQIEGTDEAEPYVVTPASTEHKHISVLSSISSALSNERLESDCLVRILWPREKCRLIRDDVILVDSPGIDVSANLDMWIENHCLDGDVFVLVVSAEATITVAEKSFLHHVAEKLSNPNIFILMNRWDATAYDEAESVESVKQQHLDRGLEFLCDELKLYDRELAKKHRMYFISAREALISRNKDPTASPRGGFNEGYQDRLVEFSKFEHEFEQCISQSAIKTKFEQHTNRGKEFMTLLRETIVNVTNTSHSSKQESVQKLSDMSKKSDELEHELRAMTETAKDKIRHISEDVYKRVAQTLNDEIKRLYTLIEEFDRPFSPDPEQIPLYKRDLHRWVEERLGSNLQTRLHKALHSSLNTVHQEIKERVKSVLSNEERKALLDSIVPRSDFAVSYRLDCSNLCSDFCEDIAFKFSLGFTNLWQRYVQNQKESIKRSTHDNELTPTSLIHSTNDLIATANNLSAVSSKSALLVLGAGVLIWRSIGWKVLGFVGGVYGSLYLYERLMWTKKAQERAFKRQYADYASSKMRLVVDMTSGNASAQVQQELSMYFAQTIRYVDMEKDEVTENIKQLRQEIDQLLKYVDKGRRIGKQGDELDAALREFSRQYLSSDAAASDNE